MILVSGHILDVRPCVGWKWVWIVTAPDGSGAFGFATNAEIAWERAGEAAGQT